jgi:hypothetical protein
MKMPNDVVREQINLPGKIEIRRQKFDDNGRDYYTVIDHNTNTGYNIANGKIDDVYDPVTMESKPLVEGEFNAMDWKEITDRIANPPAKSAKSSPFKKKSKDVMGFITPEENTFHAIANKGGYSEQVRDNGIVVRINDSQGVKTTGEFDPKTNQGILRREWKDGATEVTSTDKNGREFIIDDTHGDGYAEYQIFDKFSKDRAAISSGKYDTKIYGDSKLMKELNINNIQDLIRVIEQHHADIDKLVNKKSKK